MHKFTDDELRAYIEKLSSEYDLGIVVSDTPINMQTSHLYFKGRIRGTRGEKTVVIPFESTSFGVIRARSVLYGSKPQDVKWLFNGQPSGSRTNELISFVGSSPALSLHTSKERLREWTHANASRFDNDASSGEYVESQVKTAMVEHFDNTYNHHVKTGLYGDEVSFGRFVDDGVGDYLTLQLEEVFRKPELTEDDVSISPSI